MPVSQERPEVDVLRGIAAVLMIVHHAWARFAIELSPLGAQLVFLGGCAPVVFFVVTGLGYGLSRDRHGPLTRATLQKIGVLLVADQMMAWSHGHFFGLDFLGFIGIASLLLEGVARARRGLVLALALTALVLIVRFGFGGAAMLSRAGDAADVLGVVVGARFVDGIAYPLAPWLAYPLLGFCAGRLLRASRTREVLIGLAIVACAAAAASVLLALSDAVVFRWGTVSIAFFARSFVVLGMAVALAAACARAPLIARALSLRGASSFALVPIHYVVIWVGALALTPANGVELFALTAIAIALSFSLSRAFSSLIEAMPSTRGPTALFAGTALAAGVALLAGVPQHIAVGALAAVLLMAVGQLCLCALLPGRPA